MKNYNEIRILNLTSVIGVILFGALLFTANASHSNPSSLEISKWHAASVYDQWKSVDTAQQRIACDGNESSCGHLSDWSKTWIQKNKANQS